MLDDIVDALKQDYKLTTHQAKGVVVATAVKSYCPEYLADGTRQDDLSQRVPN